MKHFIDVEITKRELSYTTCDRCSVDIKKDSLDNEIVSVSHTFGYGSTRDGQNISFDVCEKCFTEITKDVSCQVKEVSAWDEG